MYDMFKLFVDFKFFLIKVIFIFHCSGGNIEYLERKLLLFGGKIVVKEEVRIHNVL